VAQVWEEPAGFAGRADVRLEELEVEVLLDTVAGKMQVVPGWMVLLAAGGQIHL
jgi:hypothetical protein